jgi:putative transposase
MCRVLHLPRATYYYELKETESLDHEIAPLIIEIFRKVEITMVQEKLNQKWNYVCLLVDLFNREIIGHSIGANKDAQLVCRAISSVKSNLNKISLFHTDRGNEFKNRIIEQTLEAFQIKRSLSMKGCPYDNAVAEATYKIFKTEFIKNKHFNSLEELALELSDYIHWYNHIRIHGTLGYVSPIQYKLDNLKKNV